MPSNGTRVIASAALAYLSDGVRHVAFPLFAASITREPVALSMLTATSYLPWILLGLPIGVYVDRNRPERVAVAANAGRALLMGLLCVTVLAGDRSLTSLYAVVFLLGVGEAVYDNAAQSLLPRVVEDAALERANGTLAAVERTGLDLAGPAFGGLIFATSAALPFGLNAAALMLGAVLIAPLRTAPPAVTGRPVRELFAEVSAGMRWLWRSGTVRTVILTGAGLTFFTQSWEPLLVLLAVGPMGLSNSAFGVMLAVGAVGGIAGAAVTPLLIRRFDDRILQILALAATSAAVLALAAFPTPAVTALAWGGTGFTFSLWNVLSVTMRQRLVPAELLGRVNSASRTLSTTAVPLGALAGGAVAHAWGLRAPFWLSGAAVVILAVAFATRTVRRPVAV